MMATNRSPSIWGMNCLPVVMRFRFIDIGSEALNRSHESPYSGRSPNTPCAGHETGKDGAITVLSNGYRSRMIPRPRVAAPCPPIRTDVQSYYIGWCVPDTYLFAASPTSALVVVPTDTNRRLARGRFGRREQSTCRPPARIAT